LRSVEARCLVTKDTGAAGGFPEKLAAARRLGIETVVIRRPAEEEQGREVLTPEQCFRRLDALFGRENVDCKSVQRKKISLIGAGPGDPLLLSIRGQQRLQEAELLIGSARLVEQFRQPGQRVFAAIEAEKIADRVGQDAAEQIAVVLSGDTGFFSGAKTLLTKLEQFEPEIIPGISSISTLCSRIGGSWDGAVLASSHGRNCNFISKVRRNKKVFLLSGGEGSVKRILSTLTENGLDHVRVTVGERLSMEGERITSGHPSDLMDKSFDSLSLLFIQNPRPEQRTSGWKDEKFLRGEVPMTKAEVRAAILARLQVQRDSVCWDIGAGTGSVALEMAELAEDGVVYAVERLPVACELIERNKRHLGVSNVEVVAGRAPEKLAELPVPDRVFVGGSGGELVDIFNSVTQRAPGARVAFTAVTAENFAAAVGWLSTAGMEEVEMTQISVSRGRPVGGLHLMTAQNPVFLLSWRIPERGVEG
ncbi:MAG: precorrin-6y C5,15-methyltransferase (decarboxylating) subunit CbiE, partial [Clostridia bacterium]|nr:precorrin-6y C5,15-methyltransferase (decarboxylating) subunit CbiE [Clostridia bacterium]